MNTRSFKAGEIIIAEGTYGSQTFLIVKGQVEICKETGSQGRISLALLSDGEVFGEMYLFDDTGFRTASVVALTDVTVDIIPKEEMEKEMAATSEIVRSILRTLSNRLAQTSQENSILKFQLSKSPLQSLLSLLKR